MTGTPAIRRLVYWSVSSNVRGGWGVKPGHALSFDGFIAQDENLPKGPHRGLDSGAVQLRFEPDELFSP